MVMILYYSLLIPLQATVILIWYIVNKITKDDKEEWYKFSSTSLIMVLTQVCMSLSIIFKYSSS